jgi:protein transport protein SEC23
MFLLLLLLLLMLCCSHKDLAKDAAPHFRKAKKFYDGLAAEMVAHGHICDVFSCALDNVSGGSRLLAVL